MQELHPKHGPHDPVAGTVPRRPGSLRRTTSTDILRPAGMSGNLVLAGLARDARTEVDGSMRVLAQASLDVDIDFLNGRAVSAISSGPYRPALQELVGASAASGFRGRAAKALPEEAATGSLLHQLLDDVPVATLISGYAVGVEGDDETLERSGFGQRADVCAGFQQGGTMMLELGSHGRVPVVTGPLAPDLDHGDDPLAWHPTPPLPEGGMRRRRLLDVLPGELLEVHAWFRDAYRSASGQKTIIHEYALDARVDPRSRRIVEIEARPRVLPWVECPQAAASAGGLSGTTLDDLRGRVRAELTGISTCTHLNDQLRMLADVVSLAGSCSS